MTSLFDRGLQPERTLLAWRRTVLALALGVALALRYGDLRPFFDLLWLGVLALGVLAVVYASTSQRYRRMYRTLDTNPPYLSTGGRAMLTMTIAALLLGLSAAAIVIMGQEGR